MRRLWIPLGSVVAAVALAFGVLQAVSQLAHEVEQVHEVVPADGLTGIRVEVADGRIEVVGADVDEVAIDGEVHHGLRRTTYRLTPEDGVLVVRAGCPFPSSWCDVSQRVVVPRGFDVSVDTGNGEVAVRDVDGTVEVTGSNGTIELARLGGDVTVSTSNGEVLATGLRSPSVTGTSDNGTVELTFATSPTEVVGLTSNGRVLVVVPDEEGVAFAVDARTDNGTTDVGVRTDPGSTRTITVASDNGAVAVRYP